MTAPVRSGRWAGRARAPAFFGARHGAGVGLVIMAQQVQHAVQHQDPDFRARWSGRTRAPAPGRGPAEMAMSPRTAPSPSQLGGKREHVGGVVLAAEVAVQAPQFGVAGDQACRTGGPWRPRVCRVRGEALRSARGANSAGTRRNVTLLPSGEDMAALRPARRLRRTDSVRP